MSAYKQIESHHVYTEVVPTPANEPSLQWEIEVMLRQRGIMSAAELSERLHIADEQTDAVIQTLIERGLVIRMAPVHGPPSSRQHIFYRWRRPDDTNYRWQRALLVLPVSPRTPSISHKV